MGDMLSQDEINALLSGGAAPPDEAEGTETPTEALEAPEAADPADPIDLIDPVDPVDPAKTAEAPKTSQTSDSPKALVKGGFAIADENTQYADMLTSEQKDILGEFGNISMGTSATTLSTLLSQKVNIDTPNVKIMTWADLKAQYYRPFVGIQVDYKIGIRGSNIMAMQTRDVKVISSLMLGGDGTVDEEEEINDIDLSAIGEAMNQMVGSSSTSISSMTKTKIDIDTPKSFVIDLNDDEFFDTVNFKLDEIVVCVYFNMQIGNIIQSQIMQVTTLDFAQETIDLFMKSFGTNSSQPNAKATAPGVPGQPPGGYGSQMSTQPQTQAQTQAQTQQGMPGGAQSANIPSGIMPQGNPQQGYTPPPANVSAAQFQNFDIQSVVQQKENIGIIMDVPLEVTVELGRTKKRIRDILEFTPGTIVELDKLAGEPIDVLVNGKFVAKGEVVVIDEKFGIRITDIVNPENRI